MKQIKYKFLIILFSFITIIFLYFSYKQYLLTIDIDNKNNLYNSQNNQTNNLYKTNNIVIIDMGSSGTRMHAYTIQKLSKLPNNAIPQITEIASVKSQDKKAVSYYSKNPENISEHIKPLYLELEQKLKNLNIKISTIPFYCFATAGMRFVEKQEQQKVYNELKKSLIKLGHKNKITTETIPGELEGIFDWLSVNYKLKTLQNKESTMAALDMGGASTQVAMEYKYKTKNNKNIYTLNFYDHKYKIFSKSILGYGLNKTKQEINQNKNTFSQCNININQNNQLDQHGHLIGYDLNKNSKNSYFNYQTCSQHIKSFLNSKKEHLDIAKIIKTGIKENMKLVAFSGYYYNFNLFNSKNPEELIKNIPDSCHSNRDKFKQKFPNLTEEQINENCFDATYLKILLNNGYKIPENYNNFYIPKHDIDWTVGAVLFISTDQKWIK